MISNIEALYELLPYYLVNMNIDQSLIYIIDVVNRPGLIKRKYS